MRESSIRNTPLPPSVEKAYHKKCVELKRRLNDIEEANDAARLRKRRIDRSIMKLRLERAILLDRLAKSQNPGLEDSDKSTSPPPTPQERLPRQRRAHRSPPPEDLIRPYSQHTPPPQPAPVHHQTAALAPHHHHHHHRHTNQPAPPLFPVQSSHPPAPPSGVSLTPVQAAALPHQTSPGSQHLPPPHPRAARSQNSAALDRRGVDVIPPNEQLPLIHTLPNGTNVLILPDGNPKQPPWTIRDIEPRHHLMSQFESESYEQQNEDIKQGYCPYDIQGNPVVLAYDEVEEKMKHVFKGDPDWRDPVRNKVRTDDPLREKSSTDGALPLPLLRFDREARALPATRSHYSSSRHGDEGSRRASASMPVDGRSTSGGAGGFTAVNR